MGLSTLASAATIVIIIIFAFTGLQIMTSNLDEANLLIKQKAKLIDKTKNSQIIITDFNATNITTLLVNVTFYVLNDGANNMGSDCYDVFIDGYWMNKTNISSVAKPEKFDLNIWNPGETLELRALGHFEIGEHDVTVSSCHGTKSSSRFNASLCGDDLCHGGEYCERDRLACDLLCYETYCLNGCEQTITLAGSKDNFGLFCNETGGCDTNDCVCNGEGICCGAAGSSCVLNEDCCSGVCLDLDPDVCSAYP